jgi:hypothetical protein
MGRTQHDKLRGVSTRQIIHIAPLPAQKALILHAPDWGADAGSSHGGGDVIHG